MNGSEQRLGKEWNEPNGSGLKERLWLKRKDLDGGFVGGVTGGRLLIQRNKAGIFGMEDHVFVLDIPGRRQASFHGDEFVSSSRKHSRALSCNALPRCFEADAFMSGRWLASLS